MLDQETKRRINSARDVLVGKIPDPKSQIEQITTALIYKFMDDMDRENEEIGRKATFLVKDLSEFAWGKLMSKQLTGNDRWDLFTRALTQFSKSEHIPEFFRVIFKSAYLPYRDVQTLNLFLKEINSFTYDHSERLGDAFEYLLSILGSQGHAGQFRTPRHIIDFIVEIVAPKKNETILDPACGTAGFLISSYKYIKKYNSSNFDSKKIQLPFEYHRASDVSELSIQSNGRFKGDKLNPNDKTRVAKNIIGYDIAPEMVRLSLVNMYLHGFKTPVIQEYDTLTNDNNWNDLFDVILANPPFMTPKGGIKPHNKFSVPANRSEVLFVDYIAEHLTIGGRAGIIVPEGIIFQASNAYKQLRKKLINAWGLYAVISLPNGIFLPYSGVRTSILFLDNKLAKKSDDLLFVQIHNDGFDLAAQRRKIEKNDLPQAYKVMKQWQNEQIISTSNQTIAHSINKNEITDSDGHNLSGNRYKIQETYKSQKWPMVELANIDLFSIESGGTPSTKNNLYWNGNINWTSLVDLPVGNFITELKTTRRKITVEGLKASSAKLLPKDSVLISSRATIGRIAINRIETATNQGFKNIIIKDFQKVDAYFLALCITHIVDKLNFISVGSTYKEFSKSDLAKLKVPLPPLSVQKEIINEVDGYQKIINGAQQVIENWRLKITINHEWPTVELGNVDLFVIVSGGTPSTSNYQYWNGNINWATIADLPSENIITELVNTKRKITTKGLNESSAKLLPKNSVLVSSAASIGRVAVTKTETTTHQAFKNIIIKDHQKVDPYFLAFCITKIVDKLNSISTGSTYKNLSKSDFVKSKIPLPPLSVQKEIVAEIESETKALDTCKTLIATMKKRITNKINEAWSTSGV